jgi:thiol-disulfide isomerase/thioredoxin
MKKAALLSLSVLVMLITSGCINLGGNSRYGNLTVIDEGSVLEPAFCKSKGLDAQVTVFHSPSCPACRQTVPVLEEIRDETGAKFEFIDTTKDAERINQLGIVPGHIPAVIINCRVYVGYRTKEEFEELIL